MLSKREQSMAGRFYLILFLCSSLIAGTYTEDSALFYGGHSDTFIIRWAFQELCDHVYDMRTIAWCTEPEGITIDPKVVKKGDIVFVREVNSFLYDIHPAIEHPYIMVTAGEFRDRVLPAQEKLLHDNKLIAWFSVHPCCVWFPDTFHALPLGVRQDKERYDNREELNSFFAELRKKQKEGLLCMNFAKDRCKEGICYQDRMATYNLFKEKPYCRYIRRKPFNDYITEMSRYKFVLSPSGLGPDCYRTWEAMIVGTIPIMKHGPTDELYKDLPVLIVDDWEEITEELLESTWQKFTQKRFNIEKLFIDYWAQQLFSVRDEFLKNS